MIRHAAAAALALLACYLIAAFIGLSWNPGEWDVALRILASVIGSFLAMCAAAASAGVA